MFLEPSFEHPSFQPVGVDGLWIVLKTDWMLVVFCGNGELQTHPPDWSGLDVFIQ